MFRRYLLCVSILVILFGLISSGCGKQETAAVKDDTGNRVLVVGERDAIRTLDRGFLLVEKTHVAETLLKMDEDYQIQPLLATNWKQIDDATWEFTIRDGIRFHDGSTLTATDAVRALERVLGNNPRVKERSKIVSLSAVNDRVLRMITAEPNPLLPEALTKADLYILSPASYDNKDQLVQPIGTGPFKFASWDQASGQVVVEQNPDYWGEAPGLDKMVFRPIPDANTRALALEKGEIDFTFDLPYGDIKRLQAVSGVNVELHSEPRVYRLEMNMTGEPFGDVRVRQALSHAIDRAGIVKSVLHGCGEATIGPFMHNTPWYNGDVENMYRYDPEKARSLLTEAGWVENSGNGTREKNGKPFSITIMTWSSRPGMPPMAEALQAQFREVGIEAKIQILEYGAIYDRVKEGDWDAVLASFSTSDPYGYLSGVYGSGGSQNVAKYENAVVDTLVSEAARTAGLEKRYGIYREIQEIVAKDTSVINIANYRMAVGLRDYVQGFRFNPNAHDLHTNPEMTVAK